MLRLRGGSSVFGSLLDAGKVEPLGSCADKADGQGFEHWFTADADAKNLKFQESASHSPIEASMRLLVAMIAREVGTCCGQKSSPPASGTTQFKTAHFCYEMDFGKKYGLVSVTVQQSQPLQREQLNPMVASERLTSGHARINRPCLGELTAFRVRKPLQISGW